MCSGRCGGRLFHDRRRLRRRRRCVGGAHSPRRRGASRNARLVSGWTPGHAHVAPPAPPAPRSVGACTTRPIPPATLARVRSGAVGFAQPKGVAAPEKMTVLVVEDDAVVRAWARLALVDGEFLLGGEASSVLGTDRVNTLLSRNCDRHCVSPRAEAIARARARAG